MTECQCDVCKNECIYTPGWFIPGEAEKAAEYMNLPFDKFFRQYLGVNWWERGPRTDNDIFVLAPAIVDMQPGREYPADPRGRCVFYEDGLCKIHDAKPFECAEFIHDDNNDEKNNRHWQVAEAWKEHQTQIYELLGRVPIAEKFDGNSLPNVLNGLFRFLVDLND